MTPIRRISENGVVNSILKILLCRKLLRSVEVWGDLTNVEEARVLDQRTVGLDAVMVHDVSRN
jgi:hypothetical protein